MESKERREIVEALLFASDAPVRARTLVEVIGGGVSASDVRATIRELNELYATREAPYTVEEIAGGYQLLSRPEFDPHIRKLQKVRQRSRLSRAALETLAIIAYRQPLTRPEIDDVRGVDSGGVLATLLERGLIKVSGRAEGVGRPILYATTPSFMEHFGLRSLSQLPRIDEVGAALDRRSLADEIATEVGGEPEEFEEAIRVDLDGAPEEAETAPTDVPVNGTAPAPADGADPAGSADTTEGPAGADLDATTPDEEAELTLVPAADGDTDVDLDAPPDTEATSPAEEAELRLVPPIAEERPDSGDGAADPPAPPAGEEEPALVADGARPLDRTDPEAPKLS